MKVGFYGGVEGVTGICFLLEADNKKVLIDCGLFQGLEEYKNYEPFPFNPRGIDYVVLTHAHIDHCGRIPLLVREGFRGKNHLHGSHKENNPFDAVGCCKGDV
jgi:metallo-beta-lactamase family protein